MEVSELPYSNDFPWVCPYEPATVDSGRIFGRPSWACDYTTWCSNLFWSFSTGWKTVKAIMENYCILNKALSKSVFIKRDTSGVKSYTRKYGMANHKNFHYSN